MCRTVLIQNALDRGVFKASQEGFPMCFEPFLGSLGSLKVQKIFESRQNHIYDL